MKRFGFTRKTTSSNVHEGESSSDNEIRAAEDKTEGKVEELPFGAHTTGADVVTEAQAARKLSAFRAEHFWDPNLGNDIFDEIDEAVDMHDQTHERRLVGDVFENSPYPEVRSCVRNYDIDVPVSTIRAWTIGLLLTTIASALNSYFSLRAPTITITSIVAQLVAYPVAMLWDLIFPDREFKVLGVKFNFKPGPFNIKEHTIIVVMANANFGGGFGYFLDTITVIRGFYGRDVSWGFGILTALTTQVTGFGIAGLLRQLLVEPASMMWPSQLVNVAFMYALHDHGKTNPATTNGWSVSRYRYFLYVFTGSFVWYWFPGYIATFLSVFAWVTWIRPNNVIVNQLFGGYTGLSLIPITFDWTYISAYIFSPLIAPWHAIANTLIGMVVFFWIVTIGMHYSGVLYSKYLPMSDSVSYDNQAQSYNVTKILLPNLTLNETAYHEYSPLFLSSTFSLAYGLSFASLTAILFHVGLFHGKEIWLRIKNRSNHDNDDVHTKLMRHYKRVPWWWYATLFVIMLGMSFANIYAYDTGLSGWALVVSFVLALVFTVPIGMVQAMTNVQVGLNVLTEFLIGYMQPGRPIAMMLFKTYGYITMSQALYFIQDLKLGHYLKIPQRPMFLAQVIATLWGCIVQLAVWFWVFGREEDICSRDQKNSFTCPNGRVFYTASVVWGLIGPQRIFSPGSIYSQMNWFWLIGAVLPVIVYFLARAFPKSNIRFLNMTVVFNGTANLPPATPLNYLSWGLVGFIFNKWIRSRYRGWWMRYNYITSAALDSGLAICTILISLALGLTNTTFPEWWGTTYWTTTMDWQDTAIQLPVPNNGTGHFGPDTW